MPGKHTQNVMGLWRDLPELRGQPVLDLSCGEGKSTRFLLDLGMKATATNFAPERNARILEEAEYVSVDLNGRWPFDDASFAGVNLKDVLEHLENPAHAIREASRVLRKGGALVISTPNMLNASSRLRFAFSGFYEGRKRPISYAKPPGNAGNVYIPSFQLIHYLLAQYGMRIEAMALGQYAWNSVFASVACYPLFWLGTTLATLPVRKHDLLKRGERKRTDDAELTRLQTAQRAVQRDLRRWMLSRQVLWGRNLILRARKTDAAPLALFEKDAKDE